MEVILREHVDNLGRRGEVVTVANGYARNYLLPRKMAMLATEANRKIVDRQRKIFDVKEAEERSAAEAVAARIGELECVMARRVGETDTLYGSVTSSDIGDWLAAQGVVIDRRRMQLPEPIKQLGDHEVPIKLHRDVTATIKVKVVKDEAQDEAQV